MCSNCAGDYENPEVRPEVVVIRFRPIFFRESTRIPSKSTFSTFHAAIVYAQKTLTKMGPCLYGGSFVVESEEMAIGDVQK